MSIGELYPVNSWFYVPNTNIWYYVDSVGYRKENDELSEKEANEKGYVRS